MQKIQNDRTLLKCYFCNPFTLPLQTTCYFSELTCRGSDAVRVSGQSVVEAHGTSLGQNKNPKTASQHSNGPLQTIKQFLYNCVTSIVMEPAMKIKPHEIFKVENCSCF